MAIDKVKFTYIRRKYVPSWHLGIVETKAENSTTNRITRTDEIRAVRSIAALTLMDNRKSEDIKEH